MNFQQRIIYYLWITLIVLLLVFSAVQLLRFGFSGKFFITLICSLLLAVGIRGYKRTP